MRYFADILSELSGMEGKRQEFVRWYLVEVKGFILLNLGDEYNIELVKKYLEDGSYFEVVLVICSVLSYSFKINKEKLHYVSICK